MNSIPSIKNESKHTRIISAFLLTVLFSQEIVSFSYACDSLKEMNSSFLLSESSVIYNESSPTAAKKVQISQKGKGIRVLQKVSKSYSGPGQSETSGFSLNSTDGMVDKFTGDFSYSIPLMEVEGYPIVISYNSNVGMNTEASWVGLGWDLNVGAVSREMRGIPDEFNGNQNIERTFNQKLNTIDGFKVGAYIAPGIKVKKWFVESTLSLTLLAGGYKDSYVGNGGTFDFSLNGKMSIVSPKNSDLTVGSTNLGIGYSIDTKNGITRNTTFGLSSGFGSHENPISATFGKNYNSRKGLLDQSVGLQYSRNGSFMSKTYGSTTSITYGTTTSIPRVMINSSGFSTSSNLSLFAGKDTKFKIKGNVLTLRAGTELKDYHVTSGLDLKNNKVYQPAYGFLHSGKRENYVGNDFPVMDFNRSSDFDYSEQMSNLAFSIQTFDIFHASAMGLSGTFRPRRTDFGTYYDPETKSTMNHSLDNNTIADAFDPASVNVELGITKTPIKASAPLGGFDISINPSVGYQNAEVDSKNWKNGVSNVLQFTNEANANSFDQSVYFKGVGEKTPENMNVFDLLGGKNPNNVGVIDNGSDITLTNNLMQNSTVANSIVINTLTGRPTISTYFKPKIVEELISIDPQYKSYPKLDYNNYIAPVAQPPINRNSGIRDDNHISAVEVVSNEGIHYTYGIPVYNVMNSEVSFAATYPNQPPYIDNQGLVTYQSEIQDPVNPDNSIKNNNGRSNYYDNTVVPPFAHSFLLTEMKSSDYIDLTDNGVSIDDVGSFYKINHTRFYDDGSNKYKWRFPISGSNPSANIPKAIFTQGLLGTDLDDMAHYTYGEKEVWYTHSIESKNLIAEFYLEERYDAYGVIDENGILDLNKPLQKLSKIVLYNRSDRQLHGDDAVPLQTIEFEYNYSLCKNNPSNKFTYTGSSDYEKSGKLTLTGIRIYNGKSKELGLNAYKFDYTNGLDNKDFNYQNIDAWGNYKLSIANKPNDLYPYVNQDEIEANSNLKAWKLIGIDNPLGGRTEITYEADSYGYVQNKRAMRHFDIYRMTNLFDFLEIQSNNTWNGASDVYTTFTSDLTNSSNFPSNSNPTNYTNQFGMFDPSFVPNNVIIFKLDESINATTAKNVASQIVKDNYFKDPTTPNNYLKDLYFKTHVKVKGDIKELVSSFATISNDYVNPFLSTLNVQDDFNAIGVMPPVDGSYQYGYIVVNPVNSGSIEEGGKEGGDVNGLLMNPLQRSALAYARQNLPDKVYGSCDGCDPDLSVDWKAVFGGDIYAYMIDKGGYIPEFIPSSSVVRLFEPDNEKLGGSSRVSKIKYLDNWNTMSGEYDSEYSWTYHYEDATGVTTGVASFESNSALDENPLYYWNSYLDFSKKYPDETKFSPTPIAEVLFPSPVVGYEQVTVLFDGASTKGKSVYKYFTSKVNDFITVAKNTHLDKTASVQKKNYFTGNSVSLYGLTQGYSVETNDFHGKPNQFETYDGLGNIQTRSTFKYYGLGEKVRMLDRNGNMTFEEISQEYDIHADSRYITDVTETTEVGFGIDIKFKFQVVPPSPVPVPVFSGVRPGPIFHKSTREQGFYSHTLVKHINRSAVLKGIETMNMASVNKSEDLVYDRYTGNTILSSLTDEFNDELYSMSYPSHWYYPNLRDLNGVNQLQLTCPIVDGILDATTTNPTDNLTDFFSLGDILKITQGSTNAYVWVLDQSHSKMTLINEDGTLFTGSGNYTVSLHKSNRFNRLNDVMQLVVTKKALLNADGTVFTFPSTQILSSSALDYRNKNTMICSFEDEHGKPKRKSEIRNYEANPTIPLNPFLYGTKGDLVVDKQYVWQGTRLNDQHAHGVRFDGAYTSFIPFYKLNTADHHWYAINEQNHPQNNPTNPYQRWRNSGIVSIYNEFGKILEVKDVLNNYSSVIYGYNNNLNITPVATALNARQQEIAFDGFEDYYYYSNVTLNNDQTHFDFKNQVNGTNVKVNQDVRHSGLSSLEIAPGSLAEVVKNVSDCGQPIYQMSPDDPEEVILKPIPSHEGGGHSGKVNEPDPHGHIILIYPEESASSHTVTNNNNVEDNPFNVDECECIKPFEPTTGEYIISVWVKEEDAQLKETYTTGKVNIILNGGAPVSFLPTGNIIEGWQRLERVFEIPTGTNTIKIQLQNTSATKSVYFDDFRIHPFLASMTTVVYDPNTLLPLAIHDVNNFTTFFNFDENLSPLRIKVETEEGIKTISEGEFSARKNYKVD